MIDIFSRYIVGFKVEKNESTLIAQEMIEKAYIDQLVNPDELTIHSDRGSPMTADSMRALFSFLGVTMSLSRPRVSNDNPYSESQFKTLKYHWTFPGFFTDLNHARTFCEEFITYYNNEHYHSGIAYHHPASIHRYTAPQIQATRNETLLLAYEKNPLRFNNQKPRLQALPTEATINWPSGMKGKTLSNELDKINEILVS